MRRLLAWLLMIVLAAPALAQEIDPEVAVRRCLERGYEAYRQGQLEGAREQFRRAVALAGAAPELRAAGANASYNLACVDARLGLFDEAIAALGRSVAMGFDDLEHLLSDEDLASLKGREGYEALVARLRAQRAAAESKARAAAMEAAEGLVSEAPLFDWSLEGQDLEERPQSLARYAGQIVVVLVWCSEVGVSVEMTPSLNRLAALDGVCALGLAFERGTPADAAAAAKRAARGAGMAFPTMLATRESLEAIPGFEGFPTTLVLDARGRVRARLLGLHDERTLWGVVERLRAEAPQAKPQAEPEPAAPKPAAPEPAAPEPAAPEPAPTGPRPRLY